MDKSKNNISLFKFWFWQLFILVIQFAIYLSTNWLDVYFNQTPPTSLLDKFFWSALVPITWLTYTLITYYYSHKILPAILKGLIKTIVSYALVIGSVLGFYTWIS